MWVKMFLIVLLRKVFLCRVRLMVVELVCCVIEVGCLCVIGVVICSELICFVIGIGCCCVIGVVVCLIWMGVSICGGLVLVVGVG